MNQRTKTLREHAFYCALGLQSAALLVALDLVDLDVRLHATTAVCLCNDTTRRFPVTEPSRS